MKTMWLCRGISGSGKSTLAKRLKAFYEQESNNDLIEILSTDDFFNKNGIYKFDREQLHHAHQWNINRCHQRCSVGFHVIIDNTNTTWKEILPYLDIAKAYKYNVVEVIPNTSWKNDPGDCFVKNVHGVSLETITSMIKRFQPNLQSRITEYLLNEDSI